MWKWAACMCVTFLLIIYIPTSFTSHLLSEQCFDRINTKRSLISSYFRLERKDLSSCYLLFVIKLLICRTRDLNHCVPSYYSAHIRCLQIEKVKKPFVTTFPKSAHCFLEFSRNCVIHSGYWLDAWNCGKEVPNCFSSSKGRETYAGDRSCKLCF